ncbi:unnamed protein product [Prunus armeniaca]
MPRHQSVNNGQMVIFWWKNEQHCCKRTPPVAGQRPIASPIFANASTHVSEGSAGNLSLTVRLRMSGATTIQVCNKHPPQGYPKVAKEFGVTV